MGDGMKRVFAATKATRQDTGPKLGEIAERIKAHLQRFEADPNLRETQNADGPRARLYLNAFAEVSGSRVRLGFVSYLHDEECIYKGQATQYLAWLDAGNVGRLVDWRRAMAAPPADALPWTEAHELAALERLFEIALTRLRERGISEEATARNLASRSTLTEREFASSLENITRATADTVRVEVASVRAVVAERERGE